MQQPSYELDYHRVVLNPECPDGLYGDVDAWLERDFIPGHAWDCYTLRVAQWTRLAEEMVRFVLNE